MLEITVNMNSPVEQVLAFKTCCSLKVSDQNLEILIANRGDSPVVVPSYFDLEGEETTRVRTLIPQPELRIEPGEIKAFYCQMDEELFGKAERLVLFDRQGGRYPVSLRPGQRAGDF